MLAPATLTIEVVFIVQDPFSLLLMILRRAKPMTPGFSWVVT